MLGELISVGSSLLSGWLNNEAAEDRQNSAQNFSAEQFASRYQTTVKDMQAAGLNPMLAYSQGGGNAPSGTVSNAAPYGDLGSNFTQARMATAQVANIAADTENKKAQAALIEAQAAQAWASAGQSNANVGLINASVEKVQAEINKLRGDTNFEVQQDALRQIVWKLNQEGNLAQERGISEGQSRAMMAASIQKIFTEVDLNKLDIKAAEALNNLGRTSRELKPIIDMILGVIRAGRR